MNKLSSDQLEKILSRDYLTRPTKKIENTTSGFSANTHANLVEAGLVKALCIILGGFNKNVFLTVRNTGQHNVAKFSSDFL